MELVQKKRKRLKVFFGIVWGFNLVEYGIFTYQILSFVRDERMFGTDDLWPAGLAFFLILFPCVFNYLALRLLRNYYPDRELPSWKRWFYNILGILQIVHQLFLSIGVIVFIFRQAPRQPTHQPMAMRLFIAYVWTISMIVAAVWNLSAVLVVWRTMRMIRRNHRVALLEAF